MLFNSFHFAYFFALLLPLYWLLPRRPQTALLLAASYYFYACWDPRFLALLCSSTLVDYACGLAVDRLHGSRSRRAFLGLSMAINLGFLGYFKYYNFFAESLQEAFSRLGWHAAADHLRIALPVGISFYTFQSMSYVIDIYRRDIRPTRNLIDFAAFVSFFPHLVAGPIMRPSTLLPQIRGQRRFNVSQFYAGGYLIFWGLVQKVVVADNLAVIVDDLFGRWRTLNGGLVLLAAYAFAWQVYCDFSGYTDVARGVAKCLGFELALNFNLPYFATSPKDFWARWHISLSTSLRDYLYIPLGGSRVGRLRGYANLLITMTLGGLWHGAAWPFVVWGFYQGLLLVAHKIAQPLLECIQPATRPGRIGWKLIRIVGTFHLMCVGLLVFRSGSIAQAVAMLRAVVQHLALPSRTLALSAAWAAVLVLVVQLFQYLKRDLDIVARAPWYLRSVFYTTCFYAFMLGGQFSGRLFIYFQY